MLQWLSKLILKMWGIRVSGTIPHDLKKKIYVVVPHTSNWDFPLGILINWAEKLKVNYIAKASLFKPPFGWIFKALGGIPVDRKNSTNFVRNIAEKVKNIDEVALVIAPEGTRKKVEKLKSGYYYIAKLAGIPIIPVKFDYENHEVNFGKPYYVTDNEQNDLKYFDDYYKNVLGINPKNSYGYTGK